VDGSVRSVKEIMTPNPYVARNANRSRRPNIWFMDEGVVMDDWVAEFWNCMEMEQREQLVRRACGKRVEWNCNSPFCQWQRVKIKRKLLPQIVTLMKATGMDLRQGMKEYVRSRGKDGILS
jgi:hypothetical protein